MCVHACMHASKKGEQRWFQMVSHACLLVRMFVLLPMQCGVHGLHPFNMHVINAHAHSALAQAGKCTRAGACTQSRACLEAPSLVGWHRPTPQQTPQPPSRTQVPPVTLAASPCQTRHLPPAAACRPRRLRWPRVRRTASRPATRDADDVMVRPAVRCTGGHTNPAWGYLGFDNFGLASLNIFGALTLDTWNMVRACACACALCVCVVLLVCVVLCVCVCVRTCKGVWHRGGAFGGWRQVWC